MRTHLIDILGIKVEKKASESVRTTMGLWAQMAQQTEAANMQRAAAQQSTSQGTTWMNQQQWKSDIREAQLQARVDVERKLHQALFNSKPTR